MASIQEQFNRVKTEEADNKSIPKPSNKKIQNNIYNLTEEERRILNIIPCHRVISLDEIKKKICLPTNIILSTISMLEIFGLIKTENGKFTSKQ